jgi:hypothetical protein
LSFEVRNFTIKQIKKIIKNHLPAFLCVEYNFRLLFAIRVLLLLAE